MIAVDLGCRSLRRLAHRIRITSLSFFKNLKKKVSKNLMEAPLTPNNAKLQQKLTWCVSKHSS